MGVRRTPKTPHFPLLFEMIPKLILLDWGKTMKTEQSISQRLHGHLGEIIAGSKTGERLPSEPELARRLGVSRATLREAMRTFETQGLIHRRHGAGTFVTRPSQVIESGLEVLESIETLAKRIGIQVAMGVLQTEQRIATLDEANALGLTAGSKILNLSRVILAEGHPAAYLVDILPEDVLEPNDLEEGFTGSVLDLLMQKKSLSLSISRCDITATNATVEVARLMSIQRGDVLLQFTALLYTQSGRVVDYSLSYFLPGYFRFHVVRRVG